jgi:predicted RNase H-like HicB family nuclease
MQYLAVLEQGATGWGAYVPDLPIILATGATPEEVERCVREAVALYLEELANRGE